MSDGRRFRPATGVRCYRVKFAARHERCTKTCVRDAEGDDVETAVELTGLTRAGWFEELTSGLSAASEVAPNSLSELRAPPGTFGASATEKFKARLETAAPRASVLSASIALYCGGAGGTVNTCELRITDERGARPTVRSHSASRVHSNAQGRDGEAAVRADLGHDQPDRRHAELRMIDAAGR